MAKGVRDEECARVWSLGGSSEGEGCPQLSRVLHWLKAGGNQRIEAGGCFSLGCGINKCLEDIGVL